MAKFRRYRRNRRKTTRRKTRTVGKRGFKKAPLKSIVTFGKGLPSKVMTTHKYCEVTTQTSTWPTVGHIQYRANGMFDPNITAGGHQPMYFDQLAALYDHFCVISSKITIEVVPSTTDEPIACGIFLNDNTSGETDFQTLMEYSQSSYRLIPITMAKPVTLSCVFNAKKVFGGSILSNTELQGTPSADPTEQSVFDFWLIGAYGTNVSATVTVIIEYTAIWKELKDIAGS
ncbi:capsid [uncultured virus]|uniref:Capsid n=1 Tax=uncultured virus TaxID=340016 RepID=A0A2K9LS78_9VIRU|nr:capsid [uncultured virus]